MSHRHLIRYSLGALAVGSAFALLTSPATAAQQGSACLLHPASLSETAVHDFVARPPALLDLHPAGGVVMTATVRRLAGSNFATVPVLVGLARDANVAQIVALGTGLARAANVCKRKRPDLAEKIKEEVLKAGIPALTAAFLASLTSDSVAMGDLESRPAVVAPETTSASDSFFGSGGIAQTVVRPISPAR